MLTAAPGTFARVWLVQLKDSREKDANKVFALKILRKVDGTHPLPSNCLSLLTVVFQ